MVMTLLRHRLRRPRWFVMLPLLGACALAVVARGKWSADRAGDATRRAFAEGRYSRAGVELQGWLASDPDCAEAHYYKARLAIAQRRFSEVDPAIRRARELGCGGSELTLVGALLDAEGPRHLTAEPILRQVFESKAGPDPQVDEALARIYLKTFDLKRASRVVAQWMREAPDHAGPYLWRAEIERRTEGRDESILADCREALKRDPNLAEARLGVAEALRNLYRNAEAKDEFDLYLKDHPDDASAHLGAGRNSLALGDQDDALRHLDHAVALEPENAEIHKEFANALKDRNEPARALAHLDRAIQYDPFDFNARYSRGLFLRQLGRASEADKEVAAAAKLREDVGRLNDLRVQVLEYPNDLDLQARVAEWMFDHGHDDVGASWAQKILRQSSDNPRANRLLAEYYERQGNLGLSNFYRLNAGPASARKSMSPSPEGRGQAEVRHE